METKGLILIEEFCLHSEIEISFINSLNDIGLIELTIIDYNKYLSQDQLADIEKWIRFYYELGINMEGIDAISNLLRQINDLQIELKAAKNKLSLYNHFTH